MPNPLFDALFAPHLDRETPFLIMDGTDDLTHGAFLREASRYAHTLVAMGLAPGDRLGLGRRDDRAGRGDACGNAGRCVCELGGAGRCGAGHVRPTSRTSAGADLGRPQAPGAAVGRGVAVVETAAAIVVCAVKDHVDALGLVVEF